MNAFKRNLEGRRNSKQTYGKMFAATQKTTQVTFFNKAYLHETLCKRVLTKVLSDRLYTRAVACHLNNAIYNVYITGNVYNARSIFVNSGNV